MHSLFKHTNAFNSNSNIGKVTELQANSTLNALTVMCDVSLGRNPAGDVSGVVCEDESFLRFNFESVSLRKSVEKHFSPQKA